MTFCLDSVQIKPEKNQEIGNAIFISDLQTNIINALQGRVAGIEIYEYSKAKQEYESISVEFEKIKIESKAEVKFEIEKN